MLSDARGVDLHTRPTTDETGCPVLLPIACSTSGCRRNPVAPSFERSAVPCGKVGPVRWTSKIRTMGNYQFETGTEIDASMRREK